LQAFERVLIVRLQVFQRYDDEAVQFIVCFVFTIAR
jgi:hypothetical protein